MHTLLQNLKDEVISVIGYDIVLIHVGTNDVFSTSRDAFMLNFDDCIQIIKSKNPNSTIVVSSILPRFCDFYTSDVIVGLFNDSLKSSCDSSNVKFISSFKSFLNRFKFPIYNLYSTDGLHLSVEGWRKLCIFFQNSLLFL